MKFRARDTQNNCWIPPEKVSIDGNGTVSVYNEDTELWDEGGPVDIQFYIGLKNKNGVEIYEGDVINTDVDESKYEGTWLVEWSDYGEWMVRHLNCNQLLHSLADLCSNHLGNHKPHHGVWGKVIGNMHENPELLKGGNG